MSEKLQTHPASLKVEPLTSHVILTVIDFSDEWLTNTRIRLKPGTAAKLGQILIDVAMQVQTP